MGDLFSEAVVRGVVRGVCEWEPACVQILDESRVAFMFGDPDHTLSRSARMKSKPSWRHLITGFTPRVSCRVNHAGQGRAESD